MARFVRYVSDTDKLSSITPWVLRNYVRSQGWREIDTFGDVGHVYSKDEDSEEIIIPDTQNFSDYALVVSKAILTLAEKEKRHEFTIVRDLSLAHYDRICLRVPEESEDGSISVDSGVSLFTHSRNLLLSAACSTHRPQRTFRLGSNRVAIKYIQNLRLGQTEQGSFVINLLSPVSLGLPAHAASIGSSNVPQHATFGRRVTRILSTGLQTVQEEVSTAHVERESFARIREGGIERYGVSANLCEAVGELTNAGNGSGIDISIDWAVAYPLGESRVQVRFDNRDIPVLKEAASILRNQQERMDTKIRGFVSSLNRESNQRRGRATIKATIDGNERSVRVDFTSREYNRIVRAHRRRRVVSVIGDLWFDGHRWSLISPRELEILQE